MEFEIASKLNAVTANYRLSELFTVQKVKKNQENYNMTIWLLVESYMLRFGIKLYGSTYLLNLDGSSTDIELRHAIINKDFPLENEFLFKQIYGYDNGLVCIAISYTNNLCISFLYNLNDFSCTLQHQEWGRVINEKKYSTFTDMMFELRKNNFSFDVFNIPYENVVALLS